MHPFHKKHLHSCESTPRAHYFLCLVGAAFIVGNTNSIIFAQQQANDGIWSSISTDQIKDESSAILLQVPQILDPPTEYRYASFGKPDPFEIPVQVVNTKTSVGPTIEIPLVSPLQTALTNLQVKGIWEVEGGGRKALISVVQPGGKTIGVIAKVDDPIGLKGKIVRIDADAVITRQYSFNTDGSREFSDEPLRIGNPTKNIESSIQDTGKIIIESGRTPVVFPDKPAQSLDPKMQPQGASK